MIRFHIAGMEQPTEWAEEVIRHGVGELTAVKIMSQLRADHPNAAIRIERRGDVKIQKPKLFRYKIFVKSGTAQVTPNSENPSGVIELKNAMLQSRSFQEFEREQVLAELKEKFPDATLTEETL
jgi:hypothetical protein